MDDDAVRERIVQLLRSGFDTEVEPRAYTSEAVNALVGRLRAEAGDELEAKVRVSGFTLTPYQPDDALADDVEQSCETCMYYVVHRRFCELPELALPVEKEWSCRLWRI